MDNKKKVIFSLITVLLVVSGAFSFLYISFRDEALWIPPYEPDRDLPQEYIILVDEPSNMHEMMFSASLSSIAVRDTYHPLFILDKGELDLHQLWTIEHFTPALKNAPVLLFTNNEETYNKVSGQISEELIRYNITDNTLARFRGFQGVIDVNTYEEALWVAALAKIDNKVIRLGRSTYKTQVQVWNELRSREVKCDYVLITNPDDFSTELLGENTKYYDEYDSDFHTPKLSLMTSQLAAYHNGYVITKAEPSLQQIYTFEEPNFDQSNYILNARAIGTYLTLKNFTRDYCPLDLPEYVCIVGSAAAVPQFQLPGNGDGDHIVSSDVLFGFLDDDNSIMDSAVARIINYNIQGASNQISKTLGYEYIVDTVTVDYSNGPREVNWRKKGASFSGYDITYDRKQVSPARFICKDFEDEGMDWEYFGPALVGQGTPIYPETEMVPPIEASGYLAYRGHGSDTGALYMGAYKANGDEDAVLRGTEARELFIPPQIAFFVSCMNAKIHGKDFDFEGSGGEDVPYDELLCTNYLYGGAIAVGGATEVSYSNIDQDYSTYPEEYFPGILNSEWNDENYEWNRNDAWFAFFWDGILNHEQDHGTIGKALQWATNRYMAYQASKGYAVDPFKSIMADPSINGDLVDDPGVHWKQAIMFAIYGDPAFAPDSSSMGANSYDPWHNGPDEGAELP